MESTSRIAPSHWFSAVGSAREYYLAIALILLSGCASMTSQPPPGKTTTITVKGKSYDEVWDASMAAVRKCKHLVVVEQDKDAGVIKAKEGGGASQDTVEVFINISSSTNSESYTVNVYSPNPVTSGSFSKVSIIAGEIKQTLQNYGTNGLASAQSDTKVEITETTTVRLDQGAVSGEKQADKQEDGYGLRKVGKVMVRVLSGMAMVDFLVALPTIVGGGGAL